MHLMHVMRRIGSLVHTDLDHGIDVRSLVNVEEKVD